MRSSFRRRGGPHLPRKWGGSIPRVDKSYLAKCRRTWRNIKKYARTTIFRFQKIERNSSNASEIVGNGLDGRRKQRWKLNDGIDIRANNPSVKFLFLLSLSFPCFAFTSQLTGTNCVSSSTKGVDSFYLAISHTSLFPLWKIIASKFWKVQKTRVHCRANLSREKDHAEFRVSFILNNSSSFPFRTKGGSFVPSFSSFFKFSKPTAFRISSEKKEDKPGCLLVRQASQHEKEIFPPRIRYFFYPRRNKK